MGVVYLGRDPVIGRRVALKTIRGAGEDDSEQREFSERFLREAQAAGTLSHPNIVTVHDVGEEPGTQTSFIAMEYVEGQNLKQILKDKTPLTFDRIAEIIASVADALDYAHRKGVVHRDVKPANIIITPDGTVKITDFGIAKVETSSLTSTGQFLGTPNYMSPEQVTGEEVDGRSDLFSLGVVFYELLTKRKPFVGDNLTSISYKIVHEDFPPPETFDATIPSEAGPILAKALAKDPAARYQKGSEFVRAMAEFRARLAERDMLRDLGAMVAEAEKLGPVSAVEAPGSSGASGSPTGAVKAAPGVSPATGAIPIVPTPPSPGSTTLADLARPGRADLNPELVNAPSALHSDSSIPDWSLDTDVGRGAKKPRERPPSSPGTMVGASGKRRKPKRDQANVKTQERPAVRIPAAKPKAPVPPAEQAATPPPPDLPASPPAVPLFPAVPPVPSAQTPMSPLAAAAAAVAIPPPAPAPVSPREPTAGQRLPAAAPAAAPSPEVGAATSADASKAAAPAPESVGTALKRQVNRRFVWAILGGPALIAIVIIGLLLFRRSQIEAPAPVDENIARETSERRRLLDDGNRLLAEGKPVEAKEKFLELARRAPDSRTAREKIQQAEALLARQQENQRKATEVQQRFAAAKEAEAANEYGRVLGEAEAILILDPANAEAAALKATARERLSKKGVRFPAKSPAPTPAPTKVAAAVPAASAVPEVVPTPVPTPSAVRLAVSFPSPFRQGYVMVRRNDKEIYRKNFDFGKRSNGGTVEGEVEIPTGPGEFKVWVIDADGSVREYAVLPLNVPGTERHTLLLQLDSARKLSVALR